ncbi:hypothetical protein [Nocardia cyriacigeorgica]|uniref:hypothetical protein n=1 Tax=Nocardia cyriacigeorgica TaxID=135487 RepID=UPI001893C88E|nr:hypothetical protein [Nocardia cyriacigeorgica]MBF6437060.1 hypothetical protein [Nocardia cyriacigeorgica]
MRFTVPAIVSMAAILLTGCSLFPEGPDQNERDSWSRRIESAIEAVPGVADASHVFEYVPYGPNSYYTSLLDVRLEDGTAPADAGSVVRVMAAQPLPPHYRGDTTVVQMERLTDSYHGSWAFGRDVAPEVDAAHNWARLSLAGTGAQIHWSGVHAVDVSAGSEAEPYRATAAMRRIIAEFPELAPNRWTVSPVHGKSMSENYSRLEPSVIHAEGRRRFPSGSELALWEWFLSEQPTSAIVRVSVFDPPDATGRTLGVQVFPPDGAELSAAQASQLADRHLPHLSERGGVVDYTIITRSGPTFAVLVGGCPAPRLEVAPESEPYARRYERC